MLNLTAVITVGVTVIALRKLKISFIPLSRSTVVSFRTSWSQHVLGVLQASFFGVTAIENPVCSGPSNNCNQM